MIKRLAFLATAAALLSSPALAGPAVTGSTVAEACHSWTGRELVGAGGYIGAAGFIMIFDAQSAPLDGTVAPMLVYDATAAGSWSATFAPNYAALKSGGVTICASSTGPLSKTAYATATFYAQVNP